MCGCRDSGLVGDLYCVWGQGLGSRRGPILYVGDRDSGLVGGPILYVVTGTRVL